MCQKNHGRIKRLPCDPTDLVYFRKRIGEDGARLIFETSVDLHGDDAKEREITVDTTVQEKNVTFPTDLKLMEKIIKSCWIIADQGNFGDTWGISGTPY